MFDIDTFFTCYNDAPVFYHAESGRDGKLFIIGEHLNPYLMTCDWPLFETFDSCLKFYLDDGYTVVSINNIREEATLSA